MGARPSSAVIALPEDRKCDERIGGAGGLPKAAFPPKSTFGWISRHDLRDGLPHPGAFGGQLAEALLMTTRTGTGCQWTISLLIALCGVAGCGSSRSHGGTGGVPAGQGGIGGSGGAGGGGGTVGSAGANPAGRGGASGGMPGSGGTAVGDGGPGGGGGLGGEVVSGHGGAGGDGAGGRVGSGGAPGDGGIDALAGAGGARVDAGLDAALEQEWTLQFGDKASETAYAVTVDDDGAIYVAGSTGGVLSGMSSAGSSDIFVRKYDATLSEQWTRQFGSSGADYPRSVRTDAGGNVYVFGWVSAALPGQTALGERDAFLRKYDSTGTEVWTRQFGSTGDDLGYSMAIDGAGNVFVTGHVGAAAPGQTSAGGTDVFVRKYDSAGTEIWTRQFGSAVDDYAQSLCLDANGAIYVAGYGTGGALPGQTLVGMQDAFVRKYDSSGTEVWTRQFGTALLDIGTSVGVDANGGVYVSGYTEGALAPTGNTVVSMEMFVRKYDGSGAVQWTRQLAGPGKMFAESGTVDAAGGVYVVGYIDGAPADVFVVKYDASGAQKWARMFGSTGRDYAYSIALDRSGTVYVAGGTSGAFPGQTAGGGLSDAFIKALQQ
jgi:hypothetical protein